MGVCRKCIQGAGAQGFPFTFQRGGGMVPPLGGGDSRGGNAAWNIMTIGLNKLGLSSAKLRVWVEIELRLNWYSLQVVFYELTNLSLLSLQIWMGGWAGSWVGWWLDLFENKPNLSQGPEKYGERWNGVPRKVGTYQEVKANLTGRP